MFAFAAMLSLGLPWRDWSLALRSPPLSWSRRDTCDLTQCQPRPRPHQREAWMSHTQRSTPAQNPHIHTSLGVSTATSTVRGKSQFPVLIIMRQFIYYPVPSYLNLDGWMHCIRVVWLCEPCHLMALFKTHTRMATAVCFCLSISALYFIRKFFYFFWSMRLNLWSIEVKLFHDGWNIQPLTSNKKWCAINYGQQTRSDTSQGFEKTYNPVHRHKTWSGGRAILHRVLYSDCLLPSSPGNTLARSNEF